MAYAENTAIRYTSALATGYLENLINVVAGTDVWDESMGTPNGVATNFFGTLSGSPLGLGRLVVKYTIAATEYEATDNGAGFVIGEHIDGTLSVVDYTSGNFNLDFTTPPDATTTLTGDYLYGQPGADWMLWYYGPEWVNGDNSQYGSGCNPQTVENTTEETQVIGTGGGGETEFQYIWPDDGKCFARYAMRITYTVGGQEYTAYSNEIGTIRTGDLAAVTNRSVGSLTRFETTGHFYRSAHIAFSAITWESPRQVDVLISPAPDEGTDITVKFWTQANYKASSNFCILHNTGPSGNEDIWIGFWTTEIHTYTGVGLIYSTAWSFYDTDKDNHQYNGFEGGYRSDVSVIRIWDQDSKLNVYANQRRIITVTETQIGYYQSNYTGQFIRPTNPVEYPHPLFVGGDQTGWGRNHTDITDDRHTGFYYLNGCSETPRRYICFPDSVWRRCDKTTKIKTAFGDGYDSDSVRKDIRCEPLQNGKHILHPIHIWSPYGSTNRMYLGIFDGVYKPHSTIVRPMDLIDDGTHTYRIFPDVARTEWYNFWCVKRE